MTGSHEIRPYTKGRRTYIVTDLAALCEDGTAEWSSDRLFQLLDSSSTALTVVLPEAELDELKWPSLLAALGRYAARQQTSVTLAWHAVRMPANGDEPRIRLETIQMGGIDPYGGVVVTLVTHEFFGFHANFGIYDGDGWTAFFKELGVRNEQNYYTSDLHAIFGAGTYHNEVMSGFNQVVVVDRGPDGQPAETWYRVDHRSPYRP